MGTQDVYEGVTAAIVSAIEAGAGSWVMPWRQSLPVNAITRKPYRGGNTCVLWFAAADKGFDSEEWATYRQWASVDAQVRKGERGTACLFFSPAGTKTVAVSDDDESETRTVGRRAVAKVFWVFNAAQVDGYEAKAPQSAQLSESERVASAERFFSGVGAKVTTSAAGRACYSRVVDEIQLPDFSSFWSGQDYYATSAHEHAHWTGHESRLNREYGKRFGDDAYAMEELTAELSSAFTCAYLGLNTVARPDHAAYLASWLRCLRADGRALWSVASKAQAATDFLVAAAASPGLEVAA